MKGNISFIHMSLISWPKFVGKQKVLQSSEHGAGREYPAKARWAASGKLGRSRFYVRGGVRLRHELSSVNAGLSDYLEMFRDLQSYPLAMFLLIFLFNNLVCSLQGGYLVLYHQGTYRERLKGMQILLSGTQAGPSRTGKQELEQISRNHVQTF